MGARELILSSQNADFITPAIRAALVAVLVHSGLVGGMAWIIHASGGMNSEAALLWNVFWVFDFPLAFLVSFALGAYPALFFGIVGALQYSGAVAAIVYGRRVFRAVRRHKAGECLSCGYPVIHCNTYQCPECGSDQRRLRKRAESHILFRALCSSLPNCPKEP